MDVQFATAKDLRVYQEYKWYYGERFLVLPGSIFQDLAAFRQTDKTDPESGGLLLGRRIVGTNDCIADEITSPMEGDIQERFRFFRGNGHHLRQVEYWSKTATTGQLLGAWHSHPEPDPTPSSTDYRDWAKIVRKCGMINRPLFFIIIGQKTVRVWIGIKRRLRSTLFVQCEFLEA